MGRKATPEDLSAPGASNLRRKIGLLIVLCVVLLALQLGLNALLMDDLWALSAYRAGSTEWLEHRQDVIDALHWYAGTGEPSQKRRYDQALQRLDALGDARLALFNEGPKDSEVLADLARRGLTEKEVASVYRLSRKHSTFPRGAELGATWDQASDAVEELETLARDIESHWAEGDLDAWVLSGFHGSIARLDRRLRTLEEDFLASLRDAQSILRRRILLQQIAGSGALAVLAVGLGVWTIRKLEHDAAQRQRAEEEREQLKERLRLGQKLEAVGRLAGGVAHDFNNLLTALLGYCDLLASRLGADHPNAGEVREIRRAGERAASLTSQLLAFSRKQVVDRKVVDLDRLLDQASGMIRRLIPEDIDLEWQFGADCCQIQADANQVEQLLMNLVINARDAMRNGGRLVISTECESLEVPRSGDLFEIGPGDYVRLSVTDTGTGMEREVLEHAFEPFYTTKHTGEGTGLGLATVYGIVKQNDGHIWVDTGPGRGAKFSIFFPVAEVPAQDDGEEGDPPTPRSTAEPDARAQGTTVLLAEDEDTVRRLVRDVLVQEGYAVIESCNARNALEAVRDRLADVDILLTDLVMPGGSGEELARTLLARRPELPVVYMTGYSENAVNARGVFGQGAHLLLKPFTAEQLTEAIRDALDVREEEVGTDRL